MRPLRVCFHAPLLWPLWSEGRIAFTGGAEVQQAHLARGLAARGIEMSVVSCDYGQPDGAVAHGVRVLRSYRLDAGLPVLRFFHPRLSRTLAALHHADADVYYTRGASLEAARAYEVARARGAAFELSGDHDQPKPIARAREGVSGPGSRSLNHARGAGRPSLAQAIRGRGGR